MFWCQLLMATLLLVRWVVQVYRDFHGRPAVAPDGFEGFVMSTISVVLVAILYWGAGAFSTLL